MSQTSNAAPQVTQRPSTPFFATGAVDLAADHADHHTDDNPTVINVVRPGGCDDIHYDATRRAYLIPQAAGGWVTVNEAAAKRELSIRGFSRKTPAGGTASPLERALNFVERNHAVQSSGPLAGCWAGFQPHQRRLVTESPKLIQTHRGQWSRLECLFRELFDRGGYHQTWHFWGWLKAAYEALANGNHRPGQALVLAGPSEYCTLIQNDIISRVLGGRSANAHRFLQGSTEINEDLFGAEHLMIQNESLSTRTGARRALGHRILSIARDQIQVCRPLRKPPTTLAPLWRLSIAVADDPQSLAGLPPMTAPLGQAVILLRVKQPESNDALELRELHARIVHELPAFLHWLTNWESRLRDDRYGVKSWLNPDLLQLQGSLRPEVRLLAIIDAPYCVLWQQGASPWLGSAIELEALLTSEENLFGGPTGDFFSIPLRCGIHLSRLAKSHPGRVRRVRRRTGNLWEIQPPASAKVEGNFAIHPEAPCADR